RSRDLLFAATKHPAMLVYLDNALSTAPESPGARGGKKGLNENFAREVMELHTLGVNGGYTQDDIVTLARALTGWGVNSPDARLFPESVAVLEGARTVCRPRVSLGHRRGPGGRAGGGDASAIRAGGPPPAPPIPFNWAKFLAADGPPPPLVERLAARFLETDGNIREVL